MADDRMLTVKLVSPEGLLWEGESSFAVLPALDGELGLYPLHAPLLARRGMGEMRIHSSDGIRYFALFGGFLQVADDEVQVIVDRAESPESIDADAAKAQIEKLGAKGLRDVTRHEEDLRLRMQAQTRLKVAAKAK
jgi:F-type H+-transporting ATPase subunit epsilon